MMYEDDRPPRDEAELKKTIEIYEKIKNVVVKTDKMTIYVENSNEHKLDNDWIAYYITCRGREYTIMRSYQRNHWIIYTIPQPNICISRNHDLNPEYPDLLPTNWMDKCGKIQLTHWNEVIDKFKQEAIKLL